MDLGAAQPSVLKGRSDLHTFHRLNAPHGPHQPSVKAAVPVHVGAQAGGHAQGHHLEDAAQRVFGLHGFEDGLPHAFGGLRVGAADLIRLGGLEPGQIFRRR